MRKTQEHTLPKNPRIGLVAILCQVNTPYSDRLSRLLDEYRDIIVFRTNARCSDMDVVLHSVIVRASTDQLGAFTGKLGLLTGVRVRSCLF